MNKAVQITCLAVIAAICLATTAFAQTSVTLTGPPPGYVYDNIYMSPYTATVGGATNTPVVCDDFGDNSWPNSTWNATVTSFSNITSTNTSWALAGANTQLYGAVGYLFGQILAAPSGSLKQIVDSFELWAIFDPTGVQKYLATTSVGAGTPISTAALCAEIFGACTSAAAAKPGGLLGALLQQNFSASGFSNLIILSPTNSNGALCAAGQDNCAAQEFIALSVSEGGTALAYLLVAGLCCVGAMFVRSRRLGASRINA
jgi:hypothetical protein